MEAGRVSVNGLRLRLRLGEVKGSKDIRSIENRESC